jgi:Sodium/hydrogen exchanger family
MTQAQDHGRLRGSVRRLVLVGTLALLGLVVAEMLRTYAGVRPNSFASSPVYGKGVSALLAVGLFASVYGISRRELRRNARVVLVAITLGVAVKSLLTGGIMVLAYGSAGYMLLGVAVAQIDPLSVASSLRDSDMSQRAKSILSAWACFDDPVTVLLVIYLTAVLLPHTARHGTLANVGGGSPGELIGLNIALVSAAGVAWYVFAVRRDRQGKAHRDFALCVVLVALIAVAVSFNLLVGISACGLFFRPPVAGVVSRVVDGAFYIAIFLLGLLLVAGVNVLAGVLLGASVFLVQVLTGMTISHGMPRHDRLHLALGQQNGLTAIVLALALQPYLPSAVGIIAIAVLVVNILHITSNTILERKLGKISVFRGEGRSVESPQAPKREPASTSIPAGQGIRG